MKVRIEVQVSDSRDILEVLNADVKDETYFPKDSHISVNVIPSSSRKAFPSAETMVFIFDFITGVSAGLIANWLYDRLRDKATTVIIGKHKVRIESASELTEIIIKSAKKKTSKKK
jgi:hypothetical protein